MRRLSTLLTLALVGIMVFSIGGVAGTAGAADQGPSSAKGLDSQANEPPTAAFSYSPQNPEPGQTVTLNASASSDPDGEIAEYRWDLNGDGEPETSGPNARTRFPAAGTYPVTLTVVDEDGASDSVTKEIVVAGSRKPNARFTASPTEVEVGEPVTFNATASNDPDGQIQRWEFDTNGTGTFDRTFTSPPILQINYAEPGSYTVTLRVTDNDGLTDTTTAQVVVQPGTPATTAADEGSPEVETITVTQTGPAASGPDNGGGSSFLGGIPGGGLTIVGLLVLLLLVGGGLLLYGRGSDRDRRRRGQSDDRPVRGIAIALGVTLALILIPVAVLRGRIGGVTGSETDLVLAVIELAALFLPALMLLLFVWQQIPGQQGRRGGGGVGPMSTEGFQLLGYGLGFLAIVSVLVGLAGLLLALQLPTGIALAGAFVLLGIGLTALALALAVIFLALG